MANVEVKQIDPGREFIRSEVDITKYMPEFLKKSGIFSDICIVENEEHERALSAIRDVFKQIYASDATWGIEYWENVLGIEHDETKSINERRNYVILRLQKPDTVTIKFLDTLINQYIADKSGTVTDHPETYSADFNIPLLDKANLANIERDVQIYIPAHIGQVYKTHADTNIENHIAMLKSAVKTIDVYPAAVEKIAPKSTFYVAIAMTTTERLTLYIGGI